MAKQRTRLFFATDIHGSDTCFKKFINSAQFYKAQVIILGGDITGKVLVPMVKSDNGTYSFNSPTKQLLTIRESEVEAYESKLNSVGYYPYRLPASEIQKFNQDPSTRNEIFRELILEKMRRWVQIADEKLGSRKDVRCYIQGGNDDMFEIDDILKSSKTITNPEGRVVWIDDNHEMISTGFTNMTPWNCPRDIPEQELALKIEGMASQVKSMATCIFNIHPPPYNSGLDAAPSLDKDLRPEIYGGEMIMKPVGSVAVRKAIEKWQPLLGLHGHVHESQSFSRIGRTLCLNPGSEYAQGNLRGYLVDIEGDEVKRYLPLEG